LKRTWVTTSTVDWLASSPTEGRAGLEQAVQVKNVWVPYGV
jgi:hypothetical protein